MRRSFPLYPVLSFDPDLAAPDVTARFGIVLNQLSRWN